MCSGTEEGGVQVAGIQAARALERSQARAGTEGSSAGVRKAFQVEGGSAAQAGRQDTGGGQGGSPLHSFSLGCFWSGGKP